MAKKKQAQQAQDYGKKLKTFWFRHETSTRSDEKITRLCMKHGMCGYGIYWSIIEMLYNSGGSIDNDIERIAFELRVEYDSITSVLQDFGLFIVTDAKISANRVVFELKDRATLSDKNRNNVLKRWKQDNKDTTVLRPNESGNTITIDNITKDNITQEDIKEKKNTRLEQFEKFWDFYGKKVDKKKCLDKFMRLTEEDLNKIRKTLPTYVQSTPDPQFRKNPSTYLNNRSWEDECVPVHENKTAEPLHPSHKPYIPEPLTHQQATDTLYGLGIGDILTDKPAKQ